MTAEEYKNALNHGSEIVIVSSDKDTNSAIFWQGENGNIFSFSLYYGIMERKPEELSIEKLIEHLQNMEKENAFIFVRGYDD